MTRKCCQPLRLKLMSNSMTKLQDRNFAQPKAARQGAAQGGAA